LRSGGGVSAVGFIDGGYRSNSDDTTDNEDGLASVGLGLRWFWERNVSLQFDLARSLISGGSVGHDNVRGHVELLVRY
jgi:hemolysin activation/secretion protein